MDQTQGHHGLVATLASKQALLVLSVVLIPGVLVWILYTIFFAPLHDIPGPFLARFTRLWELTQTYRGNFHETLIKLHAKHGSVVRISPGVYSFDSLDDQKKIYALSGKFIKTEYYHAAATPGQPNIFNMTDEAEHSERKKRIANLYSMSSMVNYEDAVDRMNAQLMKLLDNFVAEKKRMFVPEIMQAYAFDVIGEVTIDQNFGMMEAQGDVDNMMQLTHSSIKYQGTIGVVPEIHPYYFSLRNWLGFKNPYAKIAYMVIGQFEKHRGQLVQKENPRADPFITKLLKMEAAGKVSFLNMMDSAMSNIGAGSDTTGVTLSAALYYLYRTPRALSALRQEIDTMTSSGQISDPITFAEAQKMPYLQAVLMETLRLHPTIGYILPRKVPLGGAELAGRTFPQGATVGTSAWALHRNPQNYGVDANEFRPERFLDSTSTESTTVQLGNSFAFGAGTRTCLGKNVSLLEMTKVLPQIVRRFDVVLESEQPWELYSSWLVWPTFHARIAARA